MFRALLLALALASVAQAAPPAGWKPPVYPPELAKAGIKPWPLSEHDGLLYMLRSQGLRLGKPDPESFARQQLEQARIIDYPHWPAAKKHKVFEAESRWIEFSRDEAERKRSAKVLADLKPTPKFSQADLGPVRHAFVRQWITADDLERATESVRNGGDGAALGELLKAIERREAAEAAADRKAVEHN